MTRPVILVADDDADARTLMRAALRKAGFEVRLAEGGHEALARFDEAACDLVMLDVEMPDLGGHQVCAALRAKAGALLPIVMVTGMDDVQSVQTAYEHGATDFIAKPVNWALLGHRVRYLLRGHQALLDLRDAQARNMAILDAIPDLLFEIDLDGRYLDYRAPRAEQLAAPPESFLGRTVAEVLPPVAAAVCMQALRDALRDGTSSGAQYELRLPGGARWFELSISRKATVPGETPRFIALSRDVTERREAEARIERLAYFDSLTGLPNRQAFLDSVDRQIRQAERNGQCLAVLFADLDGFKTVNDSLGHAAGDQLLQWAAERLREGLRPHDLLARTTGFDAAHDDDSDNAAVHIARLGGDEFTAMLTELEHPADALNVAQRICALMRRPFVLGDRQITLSASVGVAVYPDDGRDAATLLKHADTAMYHAKTSGRDNAQVYSMALTEEIVRRIELDAGLREALAGEQFHLHYQPQVDARSGRVVSVEALIRWQHPTRGMVAPLHFIPLAEENGLIVDIGRWALATACADAARWHAAGLPLRVAVNLSPLQIAMPGLAAMVADALADAGLPADALELELTEGALVDNTEATRVVLEELRAVGVQLALDDFGTGYSSLAYLTRMPITHLKVDRAFVGGLLQGGHNEAIVRAVLAMSASLGLRVTAEGVETHEQAQALRRMGCDLLQGWLFAKAVPAADIAALAARHWDLGDEAPPLRRLA